MGAERITALTRSLEPVRATACWQAPGRVNLIGDHTDYCEGFVLPMAIDRSCLVAVGAGADRRVRARSLEAPGLVDIDAGGTDDARVVEPAWGRFVAGVTNALTERGAVVPALELAVTSTVPVGSGLSSSSALAVALTLALADAAGLALEPRDMARVALDGEVRAVGVPGGLMDQLTALFAEPGQALLIDCRTLSVDPIALPPTVAVLVVHSGMPRALAGSEFASRRAGCEAAAARLGVTTLRDALLDQVRDDPRARHVVTENERVLRAAAALRTGDVDALGSLLLASHASLRDDFGVSTPELDFLVELLMQHGAHGARLTGAGFGGCVVGLAPVERAPSVVAATVASYRAATGLESSAFVVNAAGAARRRSLEP